MAEEKEWTVMVYMAGDNNLSADMAYALEDIRETLRGRKDKINLMVYYDSSALGVPTLYCDFTDFDNPVYQEYSLTDRPFRTIREQNAPPRPLNNNGNSAAMYSILNFVNWCVNDTKNESGEIHQGRRAQKYALIFSGHSSAFQNMSFLIDTSADYYMTIPKLRDTLDIMTAKSNFRQNIPLLKKEIDILGFDSCVMGMLELGYEFRKFAKTMVASEGNIPSAGWSYGKILTDLICTYPNDETEIAKGFVTNFINQQTRYIIGGVSVDLAAWDLSVVEDVVQATDELAKSMKEILAGKNSEISFRLKKALLNCHWECQSFMVEQNIDLKDFCELLAEEVRSFDADDSTGLQKLCKAVIDEVDRCILMCGFSGGKYQYANGISIYFPWSILGYSTFQKNYNDLLVFSDKRLSNWKGFLEEFLTEHCLRKARVRNEENADVAGKISSVGSGYFPSEKNNHLINDKNNHLINDKNNHLINDKNNHLINDKGMLFFLSAQFKNVETPWYISGFTKKFLKEKTKKRGEI